MIKCLFHKRWIFWIKSVQKTACLMTIICLTNCSFMNFITYGSIMIMSCESHTWSTIPNSTFENLEWNMPVRDILLKCGTGDSLWMRHKDVTQQTVGSQWKGSLPRCQHSCTESRNWCFKVKEKASREIPSWHLRTLDKCEFPQLWKINLIKDMMQADDKVAVLCRFLSDRLHGWPCWPWEDKLYFQSVWNRLWIRNEPL